MRLIDADELINWIRQEPTDGMFTEEIVEAIGEQPTIEACPVVHGRWVSRGPHQGHKCGVCNDYYTDDAINLFYCPRCAAKMVEIEKIDYRRKGMPIGAPYGKTVCKHGRTEYNGNTL